MRAHTVHWLLLVAALASAGCRRGPSASAAELDELADAAEGFVAALRAGAPAERSLLAVLEHRSLLPSVPTEIDRTAARIAALEELQARVNATWSRLGSEQRFVPDLLGFERWIHNPAGMSRRQLAGLVDRMQQIDVALAQARRSAELAPRALALDGSGPGPVPAGTELPSLPPGVAEGGVRLWPLADMVVALQFGNDASRCQKGQVACLFRQVAWVEHDGALLDARPLVRGPSGDDAWHVAAGGADALFAVTIARDGQGRVDIYRPGREPATSSAQLDYGDRTIPGNDGLIVGGRVISPGGEITPAPADAAPITRAQFFIPGDGSRDWLALPDGAEGKVVKYGAVVGFVRRAGKEPATAVRLADLASGDPAVGGAPLQLAVGGGTVAVAMALPPDKLVVLVSRDGGRTWRGAGT